LTGWNPIKWRAEQLNLHMTDAQYKECTTKIKPLADIRPIAIDDADSIIRGFYNNIKTGADHPLLGDLSAQEQAAVEAKERAREATAGSHGKGAGGGGAHVAGQKWSYAARELDLVPANADLERKSFRISDMSE
jgi:hypothetical protein